MLRLLKKTSKSLEKRGIDVFFESIIKYKNHMGSREVDLFPLQGCEQGKIVPIEENGFLMKKYGNVLFKVTGYGTNNVKFTREVYRDEKRSFSMTEEEIAEFKEKLAKFNPKTLKDICLSYVSKHNGLFPPQSLPIPEELKDDLKESNNKKTI